MKKAVVNKMDDEQKTVPPTEQELPEKLNTILEDEVTVYEEKVPATQEDEDYVYVYRGEALNEAELFLLSAREDVRTVLIAGPQHSGKTTLAVMLYYLFQEGYNQALRFGGSLTIEGFRKRSEKMLLSSGETEPIFDRTLLGEQNKYLHLTLADADGQKSNLILTDISGEKFTPEYKEELGELYSDYENVILTMDGEKLADPMQRQHEILLAKQLLKNLLKSQVLTKHSKLQIICTKQDLMEGTSEQSEATIQYLEKKKNSLQAEYTEEVSSLEFCMISALKLHDKDAQEKLEQIMLKCLEGGKNETITLPEEPKLLRYFDKFKVRG